MILWIREIRDETSTNGAALLSSRQTRSYAHERTHTLTHSKIHTNDGTTAKGVGDCTRRQSCENVARKTPQIAPAAEPPKPVLLVRSRGFAWCANGIVVITKGMDSHAHKNIYIFTDELLPHTLTSPAAKHTTCALRVAHESARCSRCSSANGVLESARVKLVLALHGVAAVTDPRQLWQRHLGSKNGIFFIK